MKYNHKKLHDSKYKLTKENLKVKISLLAGKASAVILSQIKEYVPDMIVIVFLILAYAFMDLA